MKKTRRLPELTTKAKISLGLIAFVFLGSLAVFVVLNVINGQLGGGEPVQDFTKKDTTTRKTDAIASANTAMKAGDDAKAAAIYDSAISAEPDSVRKVKLAIDQSKLLFVNKKLDAAIDVAKKAENYSDQKYLISDWLGQLYEIAKQYDNAATYYAQAGANADSPTNDKGYDKSYYDQRVKTMHELAKKS